MIVSGSEIYKRIYAREKALSRWAKDGWHFRLNRQHSWSDIPVLVDADFESAQLPGHEVYQVEYNLGPTRLEDSRLLTDFAAQIVHNIQRGHNHIARTNRTELLVFREIGWNQGGNPPSHLGCIRMLFQYESSLLRIIPSYTAWELGIQPFDVGNPTFGNVLPAWKYNVRTRSACKELAGRYAGGGLRRMLDQQYKARQSQMFLHLHGRLLSHRFTKLLWSNDHLLEPRAAVESVLFNQSSSRINSIEELFNAHPEHWTFFKSALLALQ